MPSLFDAACRNQIGERLRGLTPEAPARWGTMTAARMVAHLGDQMRHTLGIVPVVPIRSWMRSPIVRFLAIHVMPWPRGRVQGPPDAFRTVPGEWLADLGTLEAMVADLGRRDPAGAWPEHPLFGPMSGSDWGYFCHRHFDHHLRQFGQ